MNVSVRTNGASIAILLSIVVILPGIVMVELDHSGVGDALLTSMVAGCALVAGWAWAPRAVVDPSRGIRSGLRMGLVAPALLGIVILALLFIVLPAVRLAVGDREALDDWLPFAFWGLIYSGVAYGLSLIVTLPLGLVWGVVTHRLVSGQTSGVRSRA